MPKRVIGHMWEPCNGKDYVNTGVDIISTEMYTVNGDTLILKNGNKFLIKYCIWGNLWITDLNKTFSAKYVYSN